jgi:hypothetical protein
MGLGFTIEVNCKPCKKLHWSLSIFYFKISAQKTMKNVNPSVKKSESGRAESGGAEHSLLLTDDR